jgi:hypothetical protein
MQSRFQPGMRYASYGAESERTLIKTQIAVTVSARSIVALHSNCWPTPGCVYNYEQLRDVARRAPLVSTFHLASKYMSPGSRRANCLTKCGPCCVDVLAQFVFRAWCWIGRVQRRSSTVRMQTSPDTQRGSLEISRLPIVNFEMLSTNPLCPWQRRRNDRHRRLSNRSS